MDLMGLFVWQDFFLIEFFLILSYNIILIKN